MFLFTVAKSQEQIQLYPFWKHNKIGWINNKGEVVISPDYNSDHLVYFHDGLAVIKTSDGKRYGYVNELGKMAISPRFTNARSFSEGYAAVKDENGVWGYIDREGDFSISPKYAYANDFNEGFASVRDKNGLWGFINKKGEYVVNPLYNDTYSFVNGMAVVRVEGKEGVVDTTGRFVFSPKYANVTLSDNGICGLWAFVRHISLFNWELHLWQLITPDGQTIKTRDELFHFSGFSEGLAEVGVVEDPSYANCATRNYYINMDGNIAIDHELSDRYCMVFGDKFSEGYAAVYLYDYKKKKQVGYGYIDKLGELVIPPQFDEADAFINGIAHVKVRGKKEGYINKKGELVFTYKARW